MASKRHKHASAFLIINTAILETDKDYEDQETGACYVNYKCKLMSVFPQRRLRIPHTLVHGHLKMQRTSFHSTKRKNTGNEYLPESNNF